MDLLDQYGSTSFVRLSQQLKTGKSDIQVKNSSFPPLLKCIKNKINNLLPRLCVTIIQNDNSYIFQKDYGKLFVMVFQDSVLYRQKYQYWSEFSINKDCNTVYIKHFLTLNSIKIKVNQPLNKKISIKLCCKLNQFLDSFKVNFQPLSGCIQFSNSFTITEQQMNIINKLQKGSSHLVQIMLQSIKRAFRYLDILLLVSGQLGLDQVVKNQNIEKCFPFLKQANQIIQNIQMEIFKIHIFKPKCEQIETQSTFFNTGQKIKNQIQYFSSNIQNILHCYTQVKSNIFFTQRSQTSSQKSFNNSLSHSYELKSNCFKRNILTLIHILDSPKDIQWQSVTEGGFGIIQAAVINFRDLNSSISQYDFKKQILIKKSDKNNYKRKIPREREVLKRFQQISHPNILKFFYTFQLQFQQFLFSQYSQNLSLDLYLQKSKKSIGIDKILFFLTECTKGLIFLHSHKIIHLDIKPANMIISKNLRLMISDFGEAFVNGNNASEHTHAYTAPFCAPQIFQSPPKILQQTDVYAIGVTIFNSIFQNKLWGHINRQYFLNCMRNQRLSQVLCPQKQQNKIVQKLLKIVQFLSLKCINKNVNLRPKLSWILQILQDLHKFICILCD